MLAEYHDNIGVLRRMMGFYAQVAAASTPDAGLAATLQAQITGWVPQHATAPYPKT
ncbi:hypothetical protein [Dactylosporangium sp. CA-092794]|uniref:hypothetical protein n=1 Tax=Dactylosporangium sp. CA-092794 TaxID=3239929 RepID=UPI003D8F4D0B